MLYIETKRAIVKEVFYQAEIISMSMSAKIIYLETILLQRRRATRSLDK